MVPQAVSAAWPGTACSIETAKGHHYQARWMAVQAWERVQESQVRAAELPQPERERAALAEASRWASSGRCP